MPVKRVFPVLMILAACCVGLPCAAFAHGGGGGGGGGGHGGGGGGGGGRGGWSGGGSRASFSGGYAGGGIYSAGYSSGIHYSGAQSGFSHGGNQNWSGHNGNYGGNWGGHSWDHYFGRGYYGYGYGGYGWGGWGWGWGYPYGLWLGWGYPYGWDSYWAGYFCPYGPYYATAYPAAEYTYDYANDGQYALAGPAEGQYAVNAPLQESAVPNSPVPNSPVPNSPVPNSTVQARQGEAAQTQNEALQYYSDARAAFEQGKYSEALRLSEHAGVESPANPKVHEMTSLSLFAIGDYRGAATEAHAALALGPPSTWAELYGYYNDNQRYTDQLRKLEKTVETVPKSAPGQFLLGYQYLMTGATAEAKEHFAQAAKLTPNDKLAQHIVKQLEAGGKVTPPELPKPPMPEGGQSL